MKISIWDILTVVLLLILAIIAFVQFVYVEKRIHYR